MQATKQQQIVVYFIEEAKEHLDTIEQGLLDLQATVADSERMNELFRAAHSIKGGAAMLSLGGILRVGHHLEDGFKLLTEYPITIDQRLEDLFLQVFDRLKESVEDLQSPYGEREQNSEAAIQAAEPVFAELQQYLNCLIKNAGNGAATCQSVPQAPTIAIDPNLSQLLNASLKRMLELFRQGDSATTRQQLTGLCARMVQLHSGSEWRGLLQTAHRALTQSTNHYSKLAPLIIKELKQAGDLLITGRASEIMPSRNLQQLCRTDQPNPLPALSLPAPATAGAPSPAHRPSLTGVRAQQLTLPAEPRAAARVLLEAFNKEQLIEIAEYLMKAIQ